MSYLLAVEFNDSVTINSTFRLQHKGIKLAYLRTHAFKSGTVVGEFTLTVKQNGVTLGSAIMNVDDINAISGTYAHGMFTWTFVKPILLAVDETLSEQEYEIEFSSTGYVGDANNNFSVCKDFDNTYIGEYGDNFNTSTPEQQACTRPYGLELYKWDN
jgi:hypothetical protein